VLKTQICVTRPQCVKWDFTAECHYILLLLYSARFLKTTIWKSVNYTGTSDTFDTEQRSSGTGISWVNTRSADISVPYFEKFSEEVRTRQPELKPGTPVFFYSNINLHQQYILLWCGATCICGQVPRFRTDSLPSLLARTVFLCSYFLCTNRHRFVSSSHPHGKGNFTVLPNHEVFGIVHMLLTLAVREDDDCTSRYTRLPSLRKSFPFSLDRRVCMCVPEFIWTW